MATKVLLIDDDTQFRKLLEIRLRSFIPALEINAHATLKDARNWLAEHEDSQFELVILDQHLPDGRGTDLLHENYFPGQAVLCLSSDTDPTLPGQTVLAGANYFLNKINAAEPLFRPLIEGLIDRNKIQRELTRLKMQAAIMDSVRTLVVTLKHEINNPLGALLGGAFILGDNKHASEEQLKTAQLIEQSGYRIKEVLDQLSSAVSLNQVVKGGQTVFHVPGDKEWKDS